MADSTPIPTFWWHVAQVVIGVTILGCITFQIVRPTHVQKDTYQSGSTKIDYWQGSTVKPGFGGCVSIKADKNPDVK